MGILSAEESSILECVMKNNVEVRNAVFEAQQTLEHLATEQAVKPPSHLKAEILKKIQFGNAESSSKEETPIIPISKHRTLVSEKSHYPTWMKVASAAAILVVGWLGYEVNLKNQQIEDFAKNNTELTGKISSLEEINTVLKNSRKIPLKGVETHPDLLAEVYWDQSNKVYLDIKNLPEAPEGKQYQLWAIVNGKPVDMGMYETESDSTIQAMKSVSNAQAFAITLEKKGGNPTPTMEEMYVMGEI
ncbi:anti-sigma factor domain-containing protein [Chryseobacterium sp.]|uniref:anti-sigma factor n=1 Tax=Chryseobacterium sp. TaxID=1871047 RepID=UPI001E2ECA0C|nr:anti-sigma factor [Chryseobacterium sp.]